MRNFHRSGSSERNVNHQSTTHATIPPRSLSLIVIKNHVLQSSPYKVNLSKKIFFFLKYLPTFLAKFCDDDLTVPPLSHYG